MGIYNQFDFTEMESHQKDVNGLDKDVFACMVEDFLSDRGEDDLLLCGEPELCEDGNWMQCVKGVDDNRIYTLHYTTDMDIYIAY